MSVKLNKLLVSVNSTLIQLGLVEAVDNVKSIKSADKESKLLYLSDCTDYLLEHELKITEMFLAGKLTKEKKIKDHLLIKKALKDIERF